MSGNVEMSQRGTDWEVTKPLLLVVSGFAGTGKTSVGREVSKQTGLLH